MTNADRGGELPVPQVRGGADRATSTNGGSSSARTQSSIGMSRNGEAWPSASGSSQSSWTQGIDRPEFAIRTDTHRERRVLVVRRVALAASGGPHPCAPPSFRSGAGPGRTPDCRTQESPPHRPRRRCSRCRPARAPCQGRRAGAAGRGTLPRCRAPPVEGPARSGLRARQGRPRRVVAPQREPHRRTVEPGQHLLRPGEAPADHQGLRDAEAKPRIGHALGQRVLASMSNANAATLLKPIWDVSITSDRQIIVRTLRRRASLGRSAPSARPPSALKPCCGR